VVATGLLAEGVSAAAAAAATVIAIKQPRTLVGTRALGIGHLLGWNSEKRHGYLLRPAGGFSAAWRTKKQRIGKVTDGAAAARRRRD
jgi:hypothetical protein